jgi:hypothetical protein
LAKAVGMNARHVVNFLAIANNRSTVTEMSSTQKRSIPKSWQSDTQLSNHITELSSTSDSYNSSYEARRRMATPKKDETRITSK